MHAAAERKMNIVMREKSVFPLLLSMSLPAMISMLIQSLYNIVDSFWVAKLGTDALTAVSLAYPLQNLIMSAGVGMGIGISAQISMFLGREDRTGASRAASMGMMLVICHCILFVIADFLITEPFLSLFTENERIFSQACEYAHIVAGLSCGFLLQLCFEKIFQGAGKMMTTMFFIAAGAIINITLDPIMIFGMFGFPAMGIKGAAYATVIAQTFALTLYIVIYRFVDLGFNIDIKHAGFEKNLAKDIYSVSIPSSLMLAFPSALTGILNAILAGIGEIYIAIFGLYFKLQTFINLPAQGVVQGMRPITGYNYGAGLYGRVRKIIQYGLLLVIIISLFGTVCSVLFPESILSLFDAAPEIIEEGVPAFRILGTGFILSSVSLVACGVLESLGNGRASLNISLLRQMIITIPLAWVLSRQFGAAGVWISLPAAELAALFAASGYLMHLFKHRLRDSGITE